MEQFKCIVKSDEDKIIGKVMWNITDMLQDIRGKNLPVYKYSVEELCSRNGFSGDANYAMKTNNSEPCIIAKLDKSQEILVDGSHRLYKAKQLGMKTIQCYVLSAEFHKKFIMDYDEELYQKVISNFIV